jgi:hypothetical protein
MTHLGGHGHGTATVAPLPNGVVEMSPPPPPPPRRAFGTLTNFDMNNTPLALLGGGGISTPNHSNSNNGAPITTNPTSPTTPITPPFFPHQPATPTTPIAGPSSPILGGSPIGSARRSVRGTITGNGTMNDDRYRANTTKTPTLTGNGGLMSGDDIDGTGAATMAAQTLAEMTVAARQSLPMGGVRGSLTGTGAMTGNDINAIHAISFNAINEPSPESQANKASLYRTVRTHLFTLRFADNRIENEFADHYRQRYLPPLRNSLKVGTLIWAGFIGYDLGRFVVSFSFITCNTHLMLLIVGMLISF